MAGSNGNKEATHYDPRTVEAVANKAVSDKKKEDAEFKKLAEDFKKNNRCVRIIYKNAHDKVVQLDNVIALLHPGAYVTIVGETEHTIIRWGQLIEVSFPSSEEMFRAMVLSAARQEKLIASMTRQPKPDGHDGFQ